MLEEAAKTSREVANRLAGMKPYDPAVCAWDAVAAGFEALGGFFVSPAARGVHGRDDCVDCAAINAPCVRHTQPTGKAMPHKSGCAWWGSVTFGDRPVNCTCVKNVGVFTPGRVPKGFVPENGAIADAVGKTPIVDRLERLARESGGVVVKAGRCPACRRRGKKLARSGPKGGLACWGAKERAVCRSLTNDKRAERAQREGRA